MSHAQRVLAQLRMAANDETTSEQAQESINERIAELQEEVGVSIGELLSDLGCSGIQVESIFKESQTVRDVLLALSKLGESTGRELVAETGHSPSTVSRALKKLQEEYRIVSSRPVLGDSRCKKFHFKAMGNQEGDD